MIQQTDASWLRPLRPAKAKLMADHASVPAELPAVFRLATVPVEPEDLFLRRAQAAAAMLFLTRTAARAFSTSPIEAFDLREMLYSQPRSKGMEMGAGQPLTIRLLPIPELLDVAAEWDAFVRSQLPETALWFAPISVRAGRQFISIGNPGPDRIAALHDALRKLAAYAGVPFHSPAEIRQGAFLYARGLVEDL